jgi:asparagine synthase (glutamine-hydrolysing)
MFAVTVGFEGAAYDESAMAERVASHLRMRHDILRFDRREYIAAFERLCREMSQPMADPATMATLLAFDLCRDRFDTVLDATGADEAAGLMPPRHVRLATEYASRLPANVRWSVSAMLHALPGTAGYAPVFDFEHPAETMIRWKGFMRPEVEALCGEPVSFEDTTFFRTYHRYPLRAHFERYSALLNAMPCDRLTEAMRISGTTVRFPFFDRATDGLIRRLPVDFRHVPGEPKRILRALLARHVPRSIWDGPKHGFDFPLRTFLAAQDHLLVRRYLSPERWEAAGLLAQRRIQDYASRFTAGDGRLTFRVWALVVLAAWLDAHELML